MDYCPLEQQFKAWWLEQKKVWPERPVSFEIALKGSKVTVKQLPSSDNPLWKDVFSYDNFHEYASVTKKMAGQCINQVGWPLEHRTGRDVQLNEVTMDDFFDFFDSLERLKDTHNLGKGGVEAIIKVLNATGQNRYGWE